MIAVALLALLASAPLRPGKDVLRSVQVGGLPRSYHAHLPPSADGKHALPAVINLHGLGSNALEQMGLTRMSALADKEGFIVLYPEGTGSTQAWNAGMCCGEALGKGVDDVAFIRAMLDDAAHENPIDPQRVYATGMSNGGFMSHRVACELSDRIAAVAPVAGLNGLADCKPKRPVPVLQFHGTADRLVQYGGGGIALFPSVDEVMAAWAKRDGCQPTRKPFFRQGEVTCEKYDGCPRGVDVELCRIDGGGHTWPGGAVVPRLGKTTGDVDATQAMWRFFREHPM